MQNKLALTRTKAGRRFMGYMKVFNSGDAEAIEVFITEYTTDEALQKNPTDEWLDQLKQIYTATGPLRLFQVIASDEYRVVVLLQAQTNNGLYITEMSISEDYPHKVAEFTLRPAERNT